MSDPDTKFKHSSHRKRNIVAKMLRDGGDHKGAFSLKVINPKKQEYKRVKMRITEIENEEEFD